MQRDEVLSAALKVFREHFRADDATGSMSAALAGLLLRRHFPRALLDVGYEKFSDLLRDLEQAQQIRIGLNAKRVLAIWFPESAPPQGPFKPLRPEVWTAFIARRPEGNRYMHRGRGEVRLGLNTPPSPIGEWVQITQIPDEVQQQWAKSFLDAADNPQNSQLRASLELDPWYYHFSLALDAMPQSFARSWRRFRSSRVIEAVNNWCQGNDVNPSLAFQSGGAQSHPTAMQPAQDIQQERSVAPSAVDVREMILQALARMPIERLLQIPIPAKYYFQPSDLEGQSRGDSETP